ncbi:MAG: hypothetical protein NTU44_11225, partial [Bacteroidetes bacterium]|nr:hypothetical protein [Bacteroidota bacterium]
METPRTLLFFCIFLAGSCVCYAQQGQWVWMKGTNTVGNVGVYGTQGVPNAWNTPPCLYEANGWVDFDGNFWLYGGVNGGNEYCDLWKYDVNTNMWTWVKGPGFPNYDGTFGVQGVPSVSNTPGSRGWGFVTWVDLQGDL